MKKVFYTIFTLILSSYALKAQQKIAGTYDHRYRTFKPTAPGILVKPFINKLAPFMIMGKDPFFVENNHVGFIDTAGRIVISPKYNNCSYFEGKYALVLIAGKSYLDYKMGLIDENGEEIIPVKYEALYGCSNGLFVAFKAGKMGFINIDDKVIVPFGLYTDYARPLYNIFERGDDVGHSDFRWEEINIHDKVLFNKYIGVKAGKKWAVIDSTGREIVPPKFEEIGQFVNDFAIITAGAKYGLANISGDIIIPALYQGMTFAGKDFVFIYIGYGNITGVISIDNKIIVPIGFRNIRPFGNYGFTATTKDGKQTLFSSDGTVIATEDYARSNFPAWGGDTDKPFYVFNSADKNFHLYQNVEITQTWNGELKTEFFYKQSNRWGIMDTTGKEVTPPLYDKFDREKISYTSLAQEVIAVNRDNKWGLINIHGETILPIAYQELVEDKGKLFAKRDGKCGFLDLSLKQQTPMKYDSLVISFPVEVSNPDVKSTVVSARINDKWGLIDNSGKEIIPFKYDGVLWVFKNLALVKNKDKYGIVNLQGKQTADCVYDEITLYVKGTSYTLYQNLLTKKDGLYGLINLSGKEVAPPVYDKIIPLYASNWYQVTYHGKQGILDGTNGRILVNCEYDDLTPKDVWPYIMAFKNGHCGLIDSTGKVSLPVIYDRIYKEDEHYLVNVDHKQGVADKNLKIIIPPKFYYVTFDKYKGIYITNTPYSMGLVKADGQVIADAVYTSMRFCGKLVILRKDNKYGTINFDGKVIDPFIYSNIECVIDKLVKTP